ncbi:tryptophan synthase subunit alpha [Psychrobacillus sp. FSL W7-1457]|uniref:tryptophan synthase subunit alpha n=1 Tax=Psychrobacillus sp. FSL W7-1457 TaxID=2954547 RepID=UPI00315AD32F
MTKKNLEQAIVNCLRNGHKAFIPYIMAGDGGLDQLKDRILFLQAAGATAIELGIPFSDPVADGPTIQQAGERALQNGATLSNILAKLEEFYEEVDVPLVLMTYFNPLLSYGLSNFAEDCERLGIAGIIVPDLPYEESEVLRDALKETDLAIVPLISLTSPKERIAKIVRAGEGFIYAITVNGITGAREGMNKDLDEYLHTIKELSNLPVMVGFGISTPEQVEKMNGMADGVIVGSAIVEAFREQDLELISSLINASKNKVIS